MLFFVIGWIRKLVRTVECLRMHMLPNSVYWLGGRNILGYNEMDLISQISIWNQFERFIILLLGSL